MLLFFIIRSARLISHTKFSSGYIVENFFFFLNPCVHLLFQPLSPAWLEVTACVTTLGSSLLISNP